MNGMNRFPKTSKNKLIIIGCVALAVILVTVSAVFVVDIFQYNTGVVTKMTATSKNNDEIELKMTYFLPMGKYSVREVAEDEGEFCGDGIKDYDGSLGKYQIVIEFGDVEPHEAFAKRANKDGIFEIKNSGSPLKAKIAHPSDHGFVLYIGSDEQICVESSNDNKLNGLCGTIRIPILVKNRGPSPPSTEGRMN